MFSIASKSNHCFPPINDFSFKQMQREMEAVFEDLFPDLSASRFVEGFKGVPISDILVDKNGNLKYEVAVTGFKPEEIDISISDGCLIVSAEKKEETKEENKEWRYIHHKLFKKNFSKRFTIPKQADTEGIKADISNGLLSILIPLKNEEKKEAKKIQINKKD